MNRAEAAAILGVSPNAPLHEAKKAYLSRVRLLHPDRFAGAAPEDVEAATTATAQLNEAWAIMQQSPSTDDDAPSMSSASSPKDEQASSTANGTFTGPTEWTDPSTACALCGWGPATPVKFNSVTGLILFWRWGTLTGPLCRLCGEAMYNESQRSTLLKGWWGVVAPIATVVAFIGNALKVRKTRALTNPVARYPHAFTALPAPIPASVRWFKRPASMIATLVALTIVTLVGASIVGTPADRPLSAGVGSCWTEDTADSSYLTEIECDSATAQYQISQLVPNGDLCTDEYISLENGQIGCLYPLAGSAVQGEETPEGSASEPKAEESAPAVEEAAGIRVVDVCTKRPDEGESCSSFYGIEPGTGYYGACFPSDTTLVIEQRLSGTWQEITSAEPYRTEDCNEEYPFGVDATWEEPEPGLFDTRVIADGDVVDEFQVSALADDAEYETCYFIDFGEGETAEDCLEGRAWVLEFCSIDGKSKFQRLFRDKWSGYANREATKDLSACTDDFPYLETVSAPPEFTPGEYEYRIRYSDGSVSPVQVTVSGPGE